MLETVALNKLRGKTVTLSFWARCGSEFTTTDLVSRISTKSAESSWDDTTVEATNYTTPLTTSWQKFSLSLAITSASVSANGLSIGFIAEKAATTANCWYELAQLQLEIGSTATSFDYRPYGTELQLCQRYCFVISGVSAGDRIGMGATGAANNGYIYTSFPVTMRSPPSLDSVSSNTWNNGVSAYTAASNNIIGSTTVGMEWYASISGASAQIPFQVYFVNTNGKLQASAEL
jgi:hypothetical protein